jgi:chaperonin GroEL
MLEDIAITTGGKVISRDLGGAVERARLEDLGSARQVRISSMKTLITAGNGRLKEIQARREQVSRSSMRRRKISSATNFRSVSPSCRAERR